MVNYYDELEIEDFAWDPDNKVFHFPCPCGDRFEISKAQLREGEEIATCPSCSLIVRVIYDYLDWEDYATTDEDDAASFASADDTPESPLANTPLVDARVKADSPSSSEAPTSEGGVSSLGQDRQVQKAYDRSRPPDGTLHVSMGQLHFGDDVETLGRQTDERLDNTSE